MNEPTPKPSTGSAPPEPDGAEDEQHRLFREALERKKRGSPGSAGGTADGGHAGVGPGTGPKTQRMFRRKSGG